MSIKTSHKDTFVIDHLPAESGWPELRFDLPEVNYPDQLNAATELLKADPNRIAILSDEKTWTYGEVDITSNQVAHILKDDVGLVPGNRVLLRAPNSPMMAICWLAVLKAGGIAVPTMPMLRDVELKKVIAKAKVSHALCDSRMVDELNFDNMLTFHNGEIEERLESKPEDFEVVETLATDPALLAFTSGTTGNPKACIHFQQDIMAMADTFSRHILKPSQDEIFAGTPPLSFTFGLGGAFGVSFCCGCRHRFKRNQGHRDDGFRD